MYILIYFQDNLQPTQIFLQPSNLFISILLEKSIFLLKFLILACLPTVPPPLPLMKETQIKAEFFFGKLLKEKDKTKEGWKDKGI